MTLRVCILSILALMLSLAGVAAGQDEQPWRPSQPAARPKPATPPTQTRPAQPIAPRTPPWWNDLPETHKQYVDQVLAAWERYGDRVKMFESKFARRLYEPSPSNRQSSNEQPKFTDLGVLKYQKPDKGLFEITGDRAEKWICDGHSFFQYNFEEKKIYQKVLPPAMRGKTLGDGPVPFIFGAKAEKMKQQYWIRPLPSPKDAKDQIWLEVWPRHHEDAADFRRAEIILSAKDMRPIGIRRYLSNGQQIRTADGQVRVLGPSYEEYSFYETVINPTDLLKFLKGDPFKPRMDRGWTKVVERMRQARTTAGGSVSRK